MIKNKKYYYEKNKLTIKENVKEYRKCTGCRLFQTTSKSNYLWRWYGTLVTIMSSLNSNAPLRSRELWLWSKCCHHFFGTNSGKTTVTMSSSRCRSTLYMYRSNGRVNSLYGDGRITSLIPRFSRSQRSFSLAVASSSKST